MNAAGIFNKSASALILASGLVAATTLMGSAADVTVPLGTLATGSMDLAYLNRPTGVTVLGGHTFDLTPGKYLSVAGGQSATLTGSFPNTKAVYLLINSYYTYSYYAGATIGTVVLTFSDATTQSTNLVVGTNLREWRPAGTNTVNTATGPGWSNVWTGQAQPTAGGGTAVIDMLTITVAGTNKTLTGVTIATSDPRGIGVISPAVTVDDGPVVLPGSGNEVGNHNGNHNNQDINKVSPTTKKAPAPAPTHRDETIGQQSTGGTHDRSNS